MNRLLNIVGDCLAVLAGLLILAVIVGVTLDVAGRYLLGRPIGWMFEAVQYALVATLFLGSPWVTRCNGHVAVDLLIQGLPRKIGRILQTAAFAMSSAVCMVLTYWAAVVVLDDFQRNVLTTGIYPIPRAYILAVICLGLALTAIEFLRLATRAFHDTLPAHQEDIASIDV